MNQKLQLKNWRRAKLGEVATIGTGGTPSRIKPEYYYGGKKFWVKTQELNDKIIYETKEKITDEAIKNSNAKIYPAKSVVVAMYGATVGKLGILGIEAATNQACAVINAKKDLADDRFIFYLLFANRAYIIKQARGAAQQNLSVGLVRGLDFLFPSFDEQKRIADILSAFDDKIELNNKINQNLEQMAQGIFKEWFVDFRFPGYEKSKFVDSELGKIPEGWEVKEINDIADIKSGFAFKGKDFVDSGRYNLVTIKNVHNGKFKIECQSRLKTLPKNMPEYCLLKTGDILLSLTGNIGRVCLFYGENYLLNQRVAKLENKKENFYAFTYLLFRSLVLKSQMEALSGGSAQQNLSPVETGRLKIIVPSNAIIEKFSKITNKIIYNILNLEQENQKLSSLRDLLLPKLMNGEVKI